MSFRVSVCTFVALAVGGPATWAQEARIERARQVQVARQGSENLPSLMEVSTVDITTGSDDDSFGIQQILREEEKFRHFLIGAEISAFATNNVALTRTDTKSDSFLLAVVPLEYRLPLPNGFQLGAQARFSTFRYNRFSQLDFNSIDIGMGLSRHFQEWGGFDVGLAYNYNHLIAAPTGDTFFKNHTISGAIQKAFSFSQAHYAYVGASGQLGFADPKIAERSELAAFAGYHLQATRSLAVDLLYRYGYYIYSEADRRDRNQTLSLAIRQQFTEWFSVFASGYITWNRSNYSVFEYDAANAGVGLTVSLQF